MDALTLSLQAILRHYFHIAPTFTSRQDQWFKRASQSWLDKHKDRELLLLTPKAAREEWAPSMLQFSKQLAAYIRTSAAMEQHQLGDAFPPRDEKLFPDSVFDEPPLMSTLDSRSKPPLPPGVQRGDWWPRQDVVDVVYETKALLEREQAAALVHLSKMPYVRIKDAGIDVKQKQGVTRHGVTRIGESWTELIDEVLLIYFFATIAGAFAEDLLTEDCRYRDWLPYGELLSDLLPPMRFMTALAARPGFQKLHHRDDLQPHVERCVRILTAADVLSQACGFPSINWESRICNNMLYFVGFEAWNREREGEGYLFCALNTKKNDKWLARGLNLDERKEVKETVANEHGTSNNGKSKLVRPRDPLRLREPKLDPAPSDSEEEEGGKLAELEREEAEYGAKRSTKYQRKRVND
ncbi:hypothetical protein NLG97_g9115 [Lecanicillium saksenae]|uniref:Uncharacterized protein n=1 Tax=Lecanicillium saksenae TaxID=468837 RepID=A0ACC1QI80_9HYPO|nr:hypothetical protein NLG97_g9115 [Lecanicillium saksenae]